MLYVALPIHFSWKVWFSSVSNGARPWRTQVSIAEIHGMFAERNIPTVVPKVDKRNWLFYTYHYKLFEKIYSRLPNETTICKRTIFCFVFFLCSRYDMLFTFIWLLNNNFQQKRFSRLYRKKCIIRIQGTSSIHKQFFWWKKYTSGLQLKQHERCEKTWIFHVSFCIFSTPHTPLDPSFLQLI